MESRPTLRARHNLSPDQIDALEERLYAFNASRTGRRDASQIGFIAEIDDEIVGAVAGYTWAGICELRQVWVHEDYRGRGLGAGLMRKAIEEATIRGCAHVFLATHDFQAPGFYEKMGFQRVAEVLDKPLGHIEITMRLSLKWDRP